MKILGDTVKKLWLHVYEEYKNFKIKARNTPSGSAAAPPDERRDLFNSMSFVDCRFTNRATKSSLQGSTLDLQSSKNKSKESIWSSDDSFIQETSANTFVVPPADKFQRPKKLKKSDVLEEEMSKAMKNIADFASVLKTNMCAKNDCDYYYEKNIHQFFKDLDDNQRNMLMRAMLGIINEFK